MTKHVMNIFDRTGHTTVGWDPRDPRSVNDARERFNDMIRSGYTAFRMNAVDVGHGISVEEKGERITEFDPQAGKLMMIPQLVGG